MFDYITDETVRAQAIADYEAEVKGLKNNNEALLGEKQKVLEKLALFADIEDPKSALEALKFVRENEQARLIQEGKFDEVVEKKVSAVRQEAKAAIDELSEKLGLTTKEAEIFRSKYRTKIVDDTLRSAAIEAGVLTEALEDVLLHGRMEFSVADDNETVESRDSNGNLKKNSDKIVVTPKVWLEGLKTRKPHFWPGSTSAGFTGKNASDSDVMAKMNELLDKGDHAGYRKLREQTLKK